MFKAYFSEMLLLLLITLLSSKLRTLATKLKDMLYYNPSNNSGVFPRDNNLVLKKNSAIGKVTGIPVKIISISSKSITTASLQRAAKSHHARRARGQKKPLSILVLQHQRQKFVSAEDEGCSSRGQGRSRSAQKRLSYSEGAATKQHR